MYHRGTLCSIYKGYETRTSINKLESTNFSSVILFTIISGVAAFTLPSSSHNIEFISFIPFCAFSLPSVPFVPLLLLLLIMLLLVPSSTSLVSSLTWSLLWSRDFLPNVSGNLNLCEEDFLLWMQMVALLISLLSLGLTSLGLTSFITSSCCCWGSPTPPWLLVIVVATSLINKALTPLPSSSPSSFNTSK